MRFVLVILCMPLLCAPAGGQTSAPDRPQLGEWDFQSEKLWEIDRAGARAFGRPAEPRVAGDGTLYVHDFEQHVSYIFRPDGSFAGAFGAQGDGPGEIPRYLNCFMAEDRVIIGEPGGLHFFTPEGTFVRSVPNNIFTRFPLVFLNDYEFLCGPGELTSLPDGIARISRVDLRTGTEVTLAELPAPANAPAPSHGPAMVVLGLTPILRMTYDADGRRLFYGRTDNYTLHISDLDGRRTATFGLDRLQRPVSAEEKRAHFEPLGLPEERLTHIVNNSPNTLTYFHQIRIHDELVYVFAYSGISRHIQRQEIDIFSVDGAYLYHAVISFEDGRYVSGSPDNLALQGDCLYAILGDDAGARSIARYRLKLPESTRSD